MYNIVGKKMAGNIIFPAYRLAIREFRYRTHQITDEDFPDRPTKAINPGH